MGYLENLPDVSMLNNTTIDSIKKVDNAQIEYDKAKNIFNDWRFYSERVTQEKQINGSISRNFDELAQDYMAEYFTKGATPKDENYQSLLANAKEKSKDFTYENFLSGKYKESARNVIDKAKAYKKEARIAKKTVDQDSETTERLWKEIKNAYKNSKNTVKAAKSTYRSIFGIPLGLKLVQFGILGVGIVAAALTIRALYKNIAEGIKQDKNYLQNFEQEYPNTTPSIAQNENDTLAKAIDSIAEKSDTENKQANNTIQEPSVKSVTENMAYSGQQKNTAPEETGNAEFVKEASDAQKAENEVIKKENEFQAKAKPEVTQTDDKPSATYVVGEIYTVKNNEGLWHVVKKWIKEYNTANGEPDKIITDNQIANCVRAAERILRLECAESENGVCTKVKLFPGQELARIDISAVNYRTKE